MTDAPDAESELSPRVRRILEVVYAVEGVATVRVWIWSGKVAIGVRPTSAFGGEEVLRRVAIAVASLREVDEAWEFGILEPE